MRTHLKTLISSLAHASVLLLAAAIAGCGGGDDARPVYRVELPELRADAQGVTSSVAFAINDRNEIVGTLDTPAGRRAYRWANTQTTDLGGFTEPAAEGIAYNINNHGVVIGTAENGDGRRAFTWANGAATRLPTLAGGRPIDAAYGINDAGDVVGISGTADNPAAVLWRAGQPTRLATLDARFPQGEAYAINASGAIAGGSGTPLGLAPVLWTAAGTAVDLGRLPGAQEEFGLALALSEANHVVGVASARTGRHAFLWDAGRLTDLGDLPGGGDLSIGYGVNDRGHVVGSSQVRDGEGDSQSATQPALLHHAFFWSPKTGMVDLNSLIDPADPLRDRVTLLESATITNAGKVTGRALVDGVVRAYVLQPVKYP